MGFTPAQVGEMSLWQFTACWQGWRRANSAEDGEGSGPAAPSPEDHMAALAFARSVTVH
jgi:hypothetical protein